MKRGAEQRVTETVFQRAARVFAARGATLYFDLSPMHEANWTGIPVVAAGLAGALLESLPGQVRFFMGYDIIDPVQVADSVRRNSGLFLDRAISHGHAQTGKLPVSG